MLVPRSVAATLVLALAGCGARTPVDPPARLPRDAGPGRPDAPPLDAGTDAGTPDAALDAGTDAGNDAGRDAPVRPDAGPIVCPPASDGFVALSLGTIDGTAGENVVSLAGDGTVVYLAVGTWDGSRVFRLDGVSADVIELATMPVTNRARLEVTDGIGRMIAFGEGGLLVLHEVRGDVLSERGRSDVPHGSRMDPERPQWNGRDVVVSGSNGFLGPASSVRSRSAR
jgi:hypothetical protein